MKVRFITAQYVKDNSVIDDNMDNKYIHTAIDLSMDKQLRQLIGTEFYDELYADAVASNGTLASMTSAHQTLIQRHEFKQYLMWSVLCEGGLFMTYKYQNKSIARKTSDNANPIDNYDIDKLKDEAKNNAEFYGERLLYWIRQNSTDYPKLSDCGDINAPASVYTSQVFTGQKRPKERYGSANKR